MTKQENAGKTTEQPIKITQLENDLVNIIRMLDEDGQALAYRYLHYLINRMVMSKDPVERIGKDLIFAVPNIGVWKELCPETKESTANVLLLTISSGLDSAMIYEYAEKHPRFLHLTYDYFEVLELIENAFDIFENVGQTEFEVYQKAYTAGIQELAYSDKGGRI